MWEDCPKHTTIKTWAREFRRTRTNTCREPGSGRQKVLPPSKTSALFTKRCHKLTSGVLLMHGKAPSQNSDVISGVWLWNASASSLFSWLSTLGLLFASENEIWTATEEIWKRQWRHGGCWRLLRGACFSLIFLKDRKTRISLANLYWCQGRLCWKTRGSSEL